MGNIQDIVSFHINEAINKTNVDEAVSISKFQLQKYLELIKKDIKAKSYEFEDVSTHGNTMMKVVFNTKLTLLISTEGNYGEIIGYNVDGLDQYNQLPKTINSYKDIKKNIKMLSFFDVKKAKPKEAIVKQDKKVNRVQINMVDELEQYGIASLNGSLTIPILKQKYPWILKCKMKNAELTLSTNNALIFDGGEISGDVCERLYVTDGVLNFKTFNDINTVEHFEGSLEAKILKNGFIKGGHINIDVFKNGNITGGIHTISKIEGGVFKDCLLDIVDGINGGDFNTVNLTGDGDITMGEFDNCDIKLSVINGGKFVGGFVDVDKIDNGFFKQSTLKGGGVSLGKFVDCYATNKIKMFGGVWSGGEFAGSVWGNNAIWESGTWKAASGVTKPLEVIHLDTKRNNKDAIDFSKFENATTRQNSNLIKKLLTQMFGGVFRVTCDTSYNIRWDDGVSVDAVKEIVNNLKEGHFDGMTDSYEYSNRKGGLIIDNKIIGKERFVFPTRTLTEETRVKLATSLSKHTKFQNFAPFNGTKDDLFVDRAETVGNSWNWGGLVRTKLSSNGNFPPAKVMALLKPEDIEWKLDVGQSYVTFTINGKKYDSRYPEVKDPKVQFMAYVGDNDITQKLTFTKK